MKKKTNGSRPNPQFSIERLVEFYKFDGAGNDFVIIDARNSDPNLSSEDIEHICHRRFGVGADGLMLLCPPEGEYNFRMKYYNSDGRPADMCGNGGRCIAFFAHLLGLSTKIKVDEDDEVNEASQRTDTARHVVTVKTSSISELQDAPAPGSQFGYHLHFVASDGPHHAEIIHWDKEQRKAVVDLSMRDVPKAEMLTVLDGRLINTGVPHYVQHVEDLEHFDVVGEGRRLRHHPDLGPEGANVNFVEEKPDGTLSVRTYERGVEDETWACGTGVTACAIVMNNHDVHTRGGDFHVRFRQVCDTYTDVHLIGPASFNFAGEILKKDNQIIRRSDIQTI